MPIFVFVEPGGADQLVVLTANATFNGVARVATKRERDIGTEAMWQFVPYQGEWGVLIDLRHGKPLVAVPRERIRHGGARGESVRGENPPGGAAGRLVLKLEPGAGCSRAG